MTSQRARRFRRALVVAVLSCAAARASEGQAAPVPILAAGEGRTFSAALTAAMRMAVESGAGATVAGAVASNGGRVTTDSVRAVSRGVVTRYALLDSATIDGGTRVKILAMVSPIAERRAMGARGSRVDAPGALWTANSAIESARKADEGAMLVELFGATGAVPGAHAYEIETGPPVRSGANLRMRLRIVRTPSPAYAALRDRAIAILAAIAGPAGSRTIHFPPRDGELPAVRSCVSRCEAGERVVLNARAALEAAGDPPPDPVAMTGTARAPFPDLFPDLYTAGGFAVAFTDSAAARQRLVHVRSTRGFVAIADYVRSVFDDAKFHLEIGDRAFDVTESFRVPRSGQPDHRFTTTSPRGSLPVELVRGFHPRSAGGPGAPTTLGSPYVVLTLPEAGRAYADTALVDVWLTADELSRLTDVAVSPPGTVIPRAGVSRSSVPLPAKQTNQIAAPSMPAAVADAIAQPPLSDGDGAVWVGGLHATAAAVGSAAVDAAAPTQACAVARLRAQRELARFITGSRIESRSTLSSSESRGAPVQEFFREEISESVAGRLAGAALAAQWRVASPDRCRVALWLREGVSVMHDSTVSPRY